MIVAISSRNLSKTQTGSVIRLVPTLAASSTWPTLPASEVMDKTKAVSIANGFYRYPFEAVRNDIRNDGVTQADNIRYNREVSELQEVSAVRRKD